MEITSLLPGVKIVKEDGGVKEDVFISQGDKVKVTTVDETVTGTFMLVEFARYSEEDDRLHMVRDEEGFAVPFDQIIDIVRAD